jgi:glycosyltransferase involved in cell wall biosynthesis
MKRKLIFLVTEDWYFHMHRLPQARAARDAGFEVVVATRVRDHAAPIEAEGFRLVPLKWRRGNLNPLEALKDVAEIARVFRREKPDIVHNVSLKAILIGTMAARRAGIGVIVEGFTGLGQLFLGEGSRLRLLRTVVYPLLRHALNAPQVHAILENADHFAILQQHGMLRAAQGTVIRGSGIDIARFTPAPPPSGGPIVAACAARMLRSKGITVLAEAMRLLSARGSPLMLTLAGSPDSESTDSLDMSDLKAIDRMPNVRYLGRITDMPGFWRSAHIGVLASLTGEGLPVSLLEAAACGLPLVATDVSGCREIVVPGETGVLVPPNEAAALADALELLAGDAALRKEYGAAARKLAEKELSAAEVGRQTVALYRKLLGDEHA